MKRILVTGGAGFIGSHLCERLLNQGHDVVCLDNFFTGFKRNIRHLLDNHRFELIRHDVTEPILLEMDQIYHLAAIVGVKRVSQNPYLTLRVNTLSTIYMLDLLKI